MWSTYLSYIEVARADTWRNMKQQLQKLVKTNSSIASSGVICRRGCCLIVTGFCREVLNELPMEFAEANKLLR